MGGVNKFIEELNQSCKSGVLMCNFDSSRFRMFLRDIMKSYFRNCENENRRKTYKAAKTIGRQESSDVWVISEATQIDGNGAIIPEDREFVWIDDLFDDNVKSQEVILPFRTQAISHVLQALKETLHTNFMASFVAIAGSALGLHYESILEAGQHFPIPVICGEHRLGKNKSARAALRLMGNDNQFFSSARERFIPRLCSRSTFPPVLDDLKNTHQLRELALAYFDGGKDGTCSREMTPKTCPIVTVNWEALELPQDYRIASRLVMIPFVVGPRSPKGLQAQVRAEAVLKEQLEDAPRALGALISINISTVLRRSKEVKLIIAEDFLEIDDRVMDNYSLLLSMGEELITIVHDEKIVKTEMLEEYFEETIYPMCIKKYQAKMNGNGASTEDGGPLITSLVMNGIHCKALTRGKLFTCINPQITFRMKTPDQGERKCNGIAVALSPFLSLLTNHGLDTLAPQDRIKQEIKNHGLGVTTKAKQVFNINTDGSTISRAKEAKEMATFKNCIFIKRSAFGPEAWEEFATCNYYSLPLVN